MSTSRTAWLVYGVLLVACTSDPAKDPIGDNLPGVAAAFDVSGDFWAAPFPSDHRVRESTRRVDLSGFPNPGGAPIVASLIGLLDDQVQGFARTGAVWIPFAGGVSTAHLPKLLQSTQADAGVFLMDVDADAPDAGTRYPVDITFQETDSVFAPAHALVALPLQGRPLPARHRMAMVVLRKTLDADGRFLTTSQAVLDLLAGRTPEGWREDVAEQYRGALDVLEAQAVPLGDIAGLTVFTTGAPTRTWADIVQAGRDAGGLSLSGTLHRTEIWPDYCVYETEVTVPFFQHGEPPFLTSGGGFVWDGSTLLRNDDHPVQEARLIFSIPRDPTPNDRRPTVVFIRTGAGGDLPLLNRSVHAAGGGDVEGSGYAATLARAGWAGVQIDGPLGGPFRNEDGSDEQFLIFNIQNPVALRDNLRQSALELALLPDFLESFALPNNAPWDCPGIAPSAVHPIRFDASNMVLFGHSMGATIAPLAAAGEPRYRGLILSGAGGSWIQNVVHKTKPVDVLPLAANMIGEDVGLLDQYHPVLSLLQWAGEPADPPLYGDALSRPADGTRARHILMYQGVKDHYIPPPVANSLSLAMGLDLAGDPYDATLASEYRALGPLLQFSGAQARPLPAGLNRVVGDDKVTAVVVQQEEDGIEDGHEVVFQRAVPHHQISCFLQGMVDDIPLVPTPGSEGDPCAEAPQTP